MCGALASRAIVRARVVDVDVETDEFFGIFEAWFEQREAPSDVAEPRECIHNIIHRCV